MRAAGALAALLAACSTYDVTIVDDPLIADFEESIGGAALDRARAYFSLGCAADSEQWAQVAQTTGEVSLEASYLIAASRAATGDFILARDLAAAALDDPSADAPGPFRSALVGLLVAIHLELGDPAGAEADLLKFEPKIGAAAEADRAISFETLPAPVHSIQYLAILKELSGDVEAAAALRTHFDFVTSDFHSSRAGGPLRPADYWILASVGAGRLTSDKAARQIQAAWTGGFRAGWPFNYGMHAAFYPFRESKAFADLFRRIESDVSSPRRAVTGTQIEDPASRGFNGMLVSKRQCGGVEAG